MSSGALDHEKWKMNPNYLQRWMTLFQTTNFVLAHFACLVTCTPSPETCNKIPTDEKREFLLYCYSKEIKTESKETPRL